MGVIADDLHRLNVLIDVVWPKAMQGDYEAVYLVLKIMRRKAKLSGYGK